MARGFRKNDDWFADFETTTDPEDCRVWGWGLADISAEPVVTVGTTIEKFFSLVKQSDRKIFFHNLEFDGSFILDWLLKHGFEWTNDKSVSPKKFSTLISNMNKFYQITVCWSDGVKTVFQDSLKKIPMPVADIPKAFNLETSKGDIDYDKPRPVGYEPTSEEYDYIRRDVLIPAKALFQQKQQGLSKMTIGADALAEYKKIMSPKLFSRVFPILPAETDKLVRLAYRGGYAYADERFRGKKVGAGMVFDVNSLYPYIMKTRSMPFGFPKSFEGKPPDNNKLFILSITFTARLKHGFLPIIQAKNSLHYRSTEYIKVVDEPLTMSVTNVDLQLFYEHYDMNILSFNGGVYFDSQQGFFDKYIDKWSTIKEQNTGGQRTIAKLFLNSLYGKFATNPDVTGKYPVLENGVVRLKLGEPETRDPVYTPVGVFITSYAREYTIRTAQKNYGNFLYADTDSLHILGDTVEGVEVHPTKLGAWKKEYDFEAGKFLRAKQYAEQRVDGVMEVRIAGAPVRVTNKLTLDDIYVGASFHGTLKSQRVPGGVVLKPTTFTIH